MTAHARYDFINNLVENVVHLNADHVHAPSISQRLDNILTHRFFGPIIMLLVIYAVYHLTFSIGGIPMLWVQKLFILTRELAITRIPEGVLRSLAVSGVIDGVGGVMSFVPLILCMFIQIAVLEDSGYMARMAYMMDRIFRTFGLHGCSIMPFIVSGGIAGGCAVPGVMAARTLSGPRERLATLLTVPFMACGAKLPVMILFASVFFPGSEAALMFSLTLTGWCAALIVALILRSTLVRGPSTPFVMELPPYRLPTATSMFIHSLDRAWMYLKKAGSVILAISILMWAAMTFPMLPKNDLAAHAALRAELQNTLSADPASLHDELHKIDSKLGEQSLRYSIAGRMGEVLSRITQPVGFDWRVNVSLIGGFAAKEVIVSTLGTAYSLGTSEDDTPLAKRISEDPIWNKATALGFLVFVLLYAPCASTLVMMRQETRSWTWPLFSLTANTLVAFVVAVHVRHTAMMF
jgi:ferrous iron transport protein B